MNNPLPITHLTLYKHGVGFFQRRGQFDGEQVALTFRSSEMNDVLKSLTAIDVGAGKVLGVDYATPQSREQRLAGNSIRLDDDRSLRDLLIGLRGRNVRLLLDQEEALQGVLLGIDELPERQPLATTPVSLLLDDSQQVRTVPLGRLQGVELLDEQAASDLRFFLETALSQDDFRRVTIRLTPGAHDLTVSYVAPAPTWRVSYRLVADEEAESALLLGWGIFDNRLEEDLDAISLSLVAGMPISFIYNLYQPRMPERPEVEDEARVAAGPVAFAGAIAEHEMAPPPMAAAAAPAAPAHFVAPAALKSRASSREEMRDAAALEVSSESLGELFQYNIGTPVSVGRGQSAMAPIIAADLPARKDLLYNGQTFPTHPVASLRLQNESGLTLERGPVTVVDNGEYVGEAIVPFTAPGDEFVVPYAVELTVRVQENSGAGSELHAVHLQEALLVVEQWEIRWREYQVNNNAANEVTVLVEHPRRANFELYDSPEPLERTDEHLRFSVTVPPRGETTLRVRERTLVSRRESLQRQSYDQLQRYLRRGLIDRATHDALAAILRLWEEIQQAQQRVQQIEAERQKIYQAQQQVQGNMGALSNTGKEGELRARYVRQLEASEEQLAALQREEAQQAADIKRLEAEVARQINAL